MSRDILPVIRINTFRSVKRYIACYTDQYLKKCQEIYRLLYGSNPLEVSRDISPAIRINTFYQFAFPWEYKYLQQDLGMLYLLKENRNKVLKLTINLEKCQEIYRLLYGSIPLEVSRDMSPAIRINTFRSVKKFIACYTDQYLNNVKRYIACYTDQYLQKCQEIYRLLYGSIHLEVAGDVSPVIRINDTLFEIMEVKNTKKNV